MRASNLKALLPFSAALLPICFSIANLPAPAQSADQPAIRIESSRPQPVSRRAEPITIDLRAQAPRSTTDSTIPAARKDPPPPSRPEARPDPANTSESTRPAALAVNAGQSTASAVDQGTSPSYSPENYRTATPEQLREEIKRLRESAERLPKGSRERRDVEDLIESHEIRLRTGVPVQDLVAEITAQVSRIRNLPVKEPVRFRILEADELKQFLNHHLEKDFPGETLPSYEFILKRLGAIPERTNLRRTIVSLLSEQIAGLYDPETKLLYVMKQFDLNRTLARIILAHEICHALQDQHYGILSMPISDRNNNDSQMASQSVLEGDATILMQDYAAETLTPQKLAELLDVFFIDQRALNKAPYFLQRQLVFPYMGGADFLQSIILAKGDHYREEALRNPPHSTEQILHPEKFTSRDFDPPTTVTLADLAPKLGPEWRKVFENVFGEFQTRTLFETWREWEVAPRAADGWDGDRYALYRRGDEWLILWMSVWDSESDAREFHELLSELMRAKVYKENYGSEEFAENTDVRVLPLHPATPADKTSVRLRFRLKDRLVLTVLSNSTEALRRVEAAEEELLKAAVDKGTD